MIINKDSSTIVIVGFWNVMIFSPHIVAEHFFKEENIETLVSINPLAPIIYKKNDLQLNVSADRVVVSSACEGNYLEKMENIAKNILDYLPKTPLRGLGVNYGFIENSPEPDFLNLFSFSDETDIVLCEWSISNRVINRRLTKGGVTLNLSLNQKSPNSISIESNFDFTVENPEFAVECFWEKSEYYKNDIINLLNECYGLTLNEGEQDA